MSEHDDPSIWYICKFCKCVFQNKIYLAKHKLKYHHQRLQKKKLQNDNSQENPGIFIVVVKPGETNNVHSVSDTNGHTRADDKIINNINSTEPTDLTSPKTVSPEAVATKSTSLGRSSRIIISKKLVKKKRLPLRQRSTIKKSDNLPLRRCARLIPAAESIRRSSRILRKQEKKKNNQILNDPTINTSRDINVANKQPGKNTRTAEKLVDTTRKVFQKRDSKTESANANHQDDLTKCQICDQMFPTQIHLFLHVESHRKQTVFACSCCKKVFNNSRNQQRHQLLVHSDKQTLHRCNFCKSFFTQAHKMVEHLKTVHSKIVDPLIIQNFAQTIVKKGEDFQQKETARKVIPTVASVKVNQYNLTTNVGQTQMVQSQFRCRYCGHIFNQMSHRDTHERVHSWSDQCVQFTTNNSK